MMSSRTEKMPARHNHKLKGMAKLNPLDKFYKDKFQRQLVD